MDKRWVFSSNGTENVGNPIFDALLVFDKWDYFESCDYAFKLEETHMMQNRHATIRIDVSKAVSLMVQQTVGTP